MARYPAVSPVELRDQIHQLQADIVAILGLAHASYTLDEFYARIAVLLASGVADRIQPWPAREEI